MIADTSYISIREVLKDIRSFCNECVGNCRSQISKCDGNINGKKCSLHKYRLKPLQINLFDGEYKKMWFALAVEIAKKMEYPFWFSEFRSRVTIAPGHYNWWGALTRRMKKEGFFQTGERRPSPRQSLNGSTEFQWSRR